MQWLALRLGVATASLLACATFAQDFANARIDGRVGGPLPNNGLVEISFSCSGTPLCTGKFTGAIRNEGCSNFFPLSGPLVWSGVDISKPGSFQGSVVLVGAGHDEILNADGTCSLKPGTSGDHTENYAGTWDGTNGSITIDNVNESGKPYHLAGFFKADVTAPPPVFPMTVTTTIQNDIATSNAQVGFRPQDAATPQNIYVFAMAPVDRVKNAVVEKAAPLQWFFRKSPTDLPVQCVLAQLSSSGQLTGVSASTLAAISSNVLTSQAVPVAILNGVPTVTIGGATFFVGYGTSAQSMLNGGINRGAVTIPGAQVCEPTAPQTGWWWNPAEDGRGFSVEKRGPNMFFASFLYDVSGRSTWYVANGLSSLEGSLFVQDLLSASGGQTLGGGYPGFPTLTKVGTVTITFNSATNGTLIWPGGTVPIQRQPFVLNGLSLQPFANQPESGWWWNEQESGRGFFMEWQGDWLDIAGYMYDEQGNSVWYLTVAQASGADQQSFSSNWWSFSDGQTLNGAWKPNRQTSDHVTPVTIQFSGPDTALMTLPNGRTTSLKRHRF